MKVAVVGSGPAGVSAAKALLDQDIVVDLLDYGNTIEPAAEQLAERLRSVHPTADDLALLKPKDSRDQFTHAVSKFIHILRGKRAVLELSNKVRLGSSFMFSDVEWGIPVAGATIARSLARGGLSNIWGASCYPLTHEDYLRWPLDEGQLAPHYRSVSKLLSLAETADGLAQIYPLYRSPTECVPLNQPAEQILDHWQANRAELLTQNIGFGRARLAVRVADEAHRHGCQRCGLCLSGCPYDAIYRADWTLDELRRNPEFEYRSSLLVKSYKEVANRVTLDVLHKGSRQNSMLTYDAVFLAAGTLSTYRIAAESQAFYGSPVALQDNDLYLIPLQRHRGTKTTAPLHFSLNELALRVALGGHSLHVQIYCLNEQVIDRFRPLLQALPANVQAAIRQWLSRFVLAFVYLPGDVSARIQATVKPGFPVGTVSIQQQKNPASDTIIRAFLKYLKKHRKLLGLTPWGPMIPSTPEGPSGGHVVGALPMSQEAQPMHSDVLGRLHGTQRVFVVDGAAVPFLPAQNSTYTIMANAHRIATKAADTLQGNKKAAHLLEY